MPDTATAEPVTEITDVGAAEPTTVEVLPNPSESEVVVPDPSPAEAEGSTSDDAEGSQYDAEIEAELEAEVARRLAIKEATLETDVEKRVRQRSKEADDGESSRVELYATAESTGQQALQAIIASHEAGEPLTRDEAQTRLRELASGVAATLSKGYEGAVKNMIDTALPEQTQDEKDALEPLIYDFRRNGRFDGLLPKVVELATARLKAENADLKKQLGDRAGLKAAAEKLAKLREATGNGVGAETPKGKAPSGDTSDEARKARLAYGTATAEDRAWLQKQYPG